MYHHITDKCCPLNESIFTQDVVDNWKTWIQKEKMLWCSSADFIVGLAPFKWPSAWKSCSVLPIGSLSSSEKKDFDPDVQIILHDSGSHGKYSKTEKVEA